MVFSTCLCWLRPNSANFTSMTDPPRPARSSSHNPSPAPRVPVILAAAAITAAVDGTLCLRSCAAPGYPFGSPWCIPSSTAPRGPLISSLTCNRTAAALKTPRARPSFSRRQPRVTVISRLSPSARRPRPLRPTQASPPPLRRRFTLHFFGPTSAPCAFPARFAPPKHFDTPKSSSSSAQPSPPVPHFIPSAQPSSLAPLLSHSGQHPHAVPPFTSPTSPASAPPSPSTPAQTATPASNHHPSCLPPHFDTVQDASRLRHFNLSFMRTDRAIEQSRETTRAATLRYHRLELSPGSDIWVCTALCGW